MQLLDALFARQQLTFGERHVAVLLDGSIVFGTEAAPELEMTPPSGARCDQCEHCDDCCHREHDQDDPLGSRQIHGFVLSALWFQQLLCHAKVAHDVAMHRAKTPRGANCQAALMIAVMVGCAHTAKEASAAAAQSGVEASVSELGDPRTRQALGELLRSPEVQSATRDLAASVTEGAVNGLTQEQQAERIQEF